MSQRPQQHRHWIVLPLLLLLIVSSLWQLQFSVVMPAAMQWVTVGTERQDFRYRSGAYGTVYNGTLNEESNGVLALRAGSALFASQGISTVRVGELWVSVLDGAIHLTRDGAVLTVSAISAPGLVQSGEQRMVVPVGTQWSHQFAEPLQPFRGGLRGWRADRKVTPLPPYFLHRQHSVLRQLTPHPDVLPTEQLQPPKVSGWWQGMLLPTARQRVQVRYEQHVLGALHSAALQGDVALVEQLVLQPEHVSALMTPQGMNVVATLLSQVPPESTALRMVLLQLLTNDERAWLLSAFHSRYREIAWLHDRADLPTELHLTRVLLQPQSLAYGDELSELFWQRYDLALQTVLETNVTNLLDHIAAITLPQIQLLAQRGYPQRSEYLAQLLQTVLAEQADLPESLQASLSELSSRKRADLTPLPAKVVVTASEPEPEPTSDPEPAPIVLAPELIETRAHQLLKRAQALFTVHSSVTAVAPNQARVRDIVFAGSQGDRQVSFTVDVVTRIVSDIQFPGAQDFPFDPPFDAFIRWITQ